MGDHDLTDTQWVFIEPFVPRGGKGCAVHGQIIVFYQCLNLDDAVWWSVTVLARTVWKLSHRKEAILSLD